MLILHRTLITNGTHKEPPRLLLVFLGKHDENFGEIISRVCPCRLNSKRFVCADFF